MAPWTHVTTLPDESAFDDFRDGPMCCLVTYHTEQFKVCSVCKGAHAMTERRFRCASPTCAAFEAAHPDDASADLDDISEPCPVIWKVRFCSAQGTFTASVNRANHLRGPSPCGFIGTPKLSVPMRALVTRQDVCGIPPRLILVNMKSDPSIAKPKRGWPTPQQLNNALKTIRRRNGTKNSIKAVQAYARENSYRDDIAADVPFVFGAKSDEEGFPYIGSGDDDDAFIVGVTSINLIDNCLKFVSSGHFVQFHADATFKLSDIGYPVISCGFTDQTRSYQVAALFVVSRRTASDYAQCFRALTRLVKAVRGRSLRADAIMGDAEDAQANGFLCVPEFAQAKNLMCFFHVLYNARKKIRHLSPEARKLIFEDITDMHFSENEVEFVSLRNAALARWRAKTCPVTKSPLRIFADYFERQWLTGRFTRWQAFHTPSGYATTNNPCEVFNSSLKSFFQRRRWHMVLLLQKLRDFLGIQVSVSPAPRNYIVTPPSDIVEAAQLLLCSRRIEVTGTADASCVYVCHITKRGGTEDAISSEGDDDNEVPQEEEEAFELVFDTQHRCSGDDGAEDAAEGDAVATTPSVEDDPALAASTDWHRDIEAEREREKASKLYDRTIKWSLRRSHTKDMPTVGWFVDVERCICSCKYFAKFGTCAHIMVARISRNMTKPGIAMDKKLTSRIVGAKTRARRKATSKSGKNKAKAGKNKAKTVSKRATGKVTAAAAAAKSSSTGRPPLAARALEVQFILN